jgi:hypothetical protein
LVLLLGLLTFTYAAPVAIRFDDIQDFFCNVGQIELMKFFMQRNIPVSVGVIGSPNVLGKDRLIVDIVLQGIEKADWELELCNHGSVHEDFSILTESEQRERLMLADENIKRVFNIAKLDCFITPFNVFNAYTIPVIQAAGYKTMSAGDLSDTNRPYPLTGQTFYRFPSAAGTSNELERSRFAPISAEQSMEQVTRQVRRDHFSVVTVHPQEFVNWNGAYTNEKNETQFGELAKLVDMITAAGHTFVPISRIAQDAPASVKSVFIGDVPPTRPVITTGAATSQQQQETGVIGRTTQMPVTSRPVTTRPFVQITEDSSSSSLTGSFLLLVAALFVVLQAL